MADENPENETEEAPKKGGLLPWIAIGLGCAVAGAAVPFLMSGEKKEVEPAIPESSYIPAPHEETIFVPMEKVVVNLDEGRLTRYLSIAVTLEVAKSKEEEVNKRLELRKAALKNWLFNTIADKNLDDIRGAAGQNRLRREIRDHFNSVLFPEGFDQIYDVLFDEFNVQ